MSEDEQYNLLASRWYAGEASHSLVTAFILVGFKETDWKLAHSASNSDLGCFHRDFPVIGLRKRRFLAVEDTEVIRGS